MTASLPAKPAPRLALVDLATLLMVIGVLNGLVAPSDPGWLALNPTPYLLVPVLLGLRYGFYAGLAAGAAAAAAILLSRHLAQPAEPWLEDVLSHRFVLISLPVTGVIVGQLAESLRRRRLELATSNAELRQQNRALDAERELLLISRHDLQLRLGLHGADCASLDEELHAMARTSREFGPAQLLAALERLAHLRGAAIYRRPAGPADGWQRAALLGDPAMFPATLKPDDHRLVGEALETGQFLAQKSLWDSPPVREPGYLAAYPMATPEDTFLLLVQDLPFRNLSLETFSVVRALCDWFRFFTVAPLDAVTGHRAVSQHDFFRALETAVSTHAAQAVPSALVRVPFATPAGIDPLDAFKELLDALPRSALLTTAIENGERTLMALLPAEPDPGAAESFRSAFEAFNARLGISPKAKPRFHQTRPDESPHQLWGRLVAS